MEEKTFGDARPHSVLKINTRGFCEFVEKAHCSHAQELASFYRRCIDLQVIYAGDGSQASLSAKMRYETTDKPSLQKIAEALPELSESTINALQSYENFMGYFSLDNNMALTNAQLGNVDYKLHISLSPDSYRQHQQVISDLLINAIKNGTIKHYKCTKATNIAADLETSRAALAALEQEATAWGVESYEAQNREQLIEKMTFDERFLNGDQYTIYISMHYDQKKLVTLCQTINKALVDLNATPGQFAISESNLTPFISFRQDTYEGQYIKATDPQLKTLQEQSRLFTYLKNEMQNFSATEIDSIQQSETSFLKGSWFLRKGTTKMAAFQELQKRIKAASPGSNDVAYEQIISDWEQANPSGPDGQNDAETYRQIIHTHRLGREEHASMTSSDFTSATGDSQPQKKH